MFKIYIDISNERRRIDNKKNILRIWADHIIIDRRYSPTVRVIYPCVQIFFLIVIVRVREFFLSDQSPKILD